MRLIGLLDWDETRTNLKEALHLTPNDPVQLLRPGTEAALSSDGAKVGSVTLNAKRKASEDDEAGMPVDGDEVKRTKVDGAATSASSLALEKDPMIAHAQTAAAYIPFLKPEHVMPPKLPTRPEMESILLDLRKKALVDEYFGDGET